MRGAELAIIDDDRQQARQRVAAQAAGACVAM
jgi:hypothetical protein